MPTDTQDRLAAIKAECEKRGWIVLTLSKGNAICPTSKDLGGMLNFRTNERGLNLAELLLRATAKDAVKVKHAWGSGELEPSIDLPDAPDGYEYVIVRRRKVE